MQRVYSTPTELEAHEVRLFLESQGLRAVVVGESVAFTNFSFTPGSEPGVLVDVADADRATELLRDHFASGPAASTDCDWKCIHCAEISGPSFDVCWNCDRPRSGDELAVAAEPTNDDAEALSDDDSPVDALAVAPLEGVTSDGQEKRPATLPSTPRALVDVALLLAIALPWPFGVWLYELLVGSADTSTFVSQSISSIAFELVGAGCAMGIVLPSGEHWSRFGFRPIEPIYTLFGTGVLYIVTAFAITMSNGLFHDFARGWLDPKTYHSLFQQSTSWIPPRSGFDAMLALVLSLSIGFAEELTFRGILIPRFEQLLKSTFLSVLVTSLLFSYIHWQQGPLSAWNAWGIGLIFGTVFAHFRSLWPLVFTHALIDFVVLLRSGTEAY